MAKKEVTLLALLVFLSACSSTKKKKTAEVPSYPTTLMNSSDVPTEEQQPPAPPSINAENLPAPETPAAPPMPTLKDVQIAAYIDGIGYDAFTGLGFMQELEKTGVKPVKMVGTGFGCWVAVSWALENSGNRAEWQGFKWTKWYTLPQKGLLNRIKGAIGAEDRFASEIEKITSTIRFDKLQMPADCPNIENQGNFVLQSSRAGEIPHALWVEMLHPALGVPEGYYDGEKQVSGIFAGFPTDDEWDDLSHDTPGGSQPVLWLCLRTRSADERKSGVENLQILGMRQEANFSGIRRTSKGNYYMVIDLVGTKRGLDALKNAASRRKFLLDGHKVAKKMLADKTIEKAFSEMFAPPAAAPTAAPTTSDATTPAVTPVTSDPLAPNLAVPPPSSAPAPTTAPQN